MFGLSRVSDAPSTTYGSIDFAIYLSIVTSSNLLPELKKAVSIYKGTDEVVAEV
jgi:hypothetical protein